MQSNWFTPSTVGNVLLANTEDCVYEVSDNGIISQFKGSQRTENMRCFLDKLQNHKPHFIGTLHPMPLDNLHERAQWLPGIAAGAWFELYESENNVHYRFRRISPHGHIDCDVLFEVDDVSFSYNKPFEFVHYSNCKFFHIKQNETIFKFERSN